MAAETGSTYISGTMIDSVAIQTVKSGIFNYDKFKKVLANDRNNDRLRYCITILFSGTHFQCIAPAYMYLCNGNGNAKTTFLLLFVTL